MMLGDVLDRKEAFLDNKNMYLICPKNRKFSQGVNPWFWSKNQTFVMVCFLLKIGPEMMFGYVLDRKEAFLEDKKMYLICNPWFWSKIWTFFIVWFSWKKAQKWCLGIDRKEAFLNHQNIYLIFPKKRKFSKGVNPWFWSKIRPFFIVCFLLENRPRNDVWGCSR